MSKNERMVGISRRTLVKSTAIGSLALAAGGFSLPFTLRNAAAAVQQAREKVVWGACSVNCGSRCALRLHVKDNDTSFGLMGEKIASNGTKTLTELLTIKLKKTG